MFENVGRKIKGLAKVLFWVEVVIFCIVGFVSMVENSVLAGLLFIAMGVLGGWISAMFLYGFGEIIDKLTDIEKNTHTEVNRYDSNEIQ